MSDSSIDRLWMSLPRRLPVAQIPSDSRTVESERAKNRRSGSRGRRRSLETAVRARSDIRNERNPLARRHLPLEQRHIPLDELPAKDRTRPLRVEAATSDIEAAYDRKEGRAR